MASVFSVSSVPLWNLSLHSLRIAGIGEMDLGGMPLRIGDWESLRFWIPAGITDGSRGVEERSRRAPPDGNSKGSAPRSSGVQERAAISMDVRTLCDPLRGRIQR